MADFVINRKAGLPKGDPLVSSVFFLGMDKVIKCITVIILLFVVGCATPTLQEISIELPSEEWKKISDRPLQFQRKEGKRPPYRRAQSISIWSIGVPPEFRALTRQELVSKYFDYERHLPRYQGRWEEFIEKEHEIEGHRYPALKVNVEYENLWSVAEHLFLIYFPQDFEVRQKYFVFMWMDFHPSDVQARGLNDFNKIVDSIQIQSSQQSSDYVLFGLLIAALKGDNKEVLKFIEKGSDVNIKDKDGMTPLIFAAIKGHVEVVKTLVENRADVNVGSKQGSTALIAAAERGHVEIMEILIANGALIDAKNNVGGTALMYAAQEGLTTAVESLIAKNSDVNAMDNNGVTILMSTALVTRSPLLSPERLRKGKADVVKILIENGSSVNAQAENGWTALHFAAMNGWLEVVRTLIENGANLNTKGKRGETSLMLSAFNGKPDVVKLLIEKGADVNTKDKAGFTALHHAERNRQKEIIDILKAAGAE